MGGQQSQLASAQEPAPLPDWVQRQHFQEIDSTQSFVEREHEGFDQSKLTVVSADFQSSGRGTRDRRWEASKCQSVLMTFFFRFPAERPTSFVNQNVANTTKVLSLAAVDALQSSVQELKFGIKWPNDIVVSGKKLGGILARAVPTGCVYPKCLPNIPRVQRFGLPPPPGGRLDGVIIGVGVNVNTPADVLSQINRPVWPPASLLGETGRLYDVELLRRAVIARFAEELPLFFEQGFSAFRERVNNREALIGTEVRFRVHDTEVIDGIFAGADDAGHICLRLPSGEVKSFPAGEIVPRPPGS